MGAVFGNISVMQFANLLIFFGLLVLIVVLAVLLAAHFSRNGRQQKLILSHIDGTVAEIRDAVLAEQQKSGSSGGDCPQNQDSEKQKLTVVRIDNRIEPVHRSVHRRPAVVRIDGRVPEETESEHPEKTPAAPDSSVPSGDSAQPLRDAGTEKDSGSARLEEPGQNVLEHPDSARGIRYRSRDCGTDKNGMIHSVDQLRKQIQ